MVNNELIESVLFVDVAIGIVFKDANTFLLAQRPAGKSYAGYWEFPGGKIEKNETPEQALLREFDEELAIKIENAQFWRLQTHEYSTINVRLHVFKIIDWSGQIRSCEGQNLSWQTMPTSVTPILPATEILVQSLKNHPF